MFELNEIEKRILDYLEKNNDKNIFKKKIHQDLNISYPTILKRLEILELKKLITIENLGNTNLIKIVKMPKN